MNLLTVNPEMLIKKIDPLLRTYEYTCFQMLSPYISRIHLYTDFLNSIEEFELKNIWNDIISKWNKMKRELINNPAFKRSRYSKGEYHQIHLYINQEYLNS